MARERSPRAVTTLMRRRRLEIAAVALAALAVASAVAIALPRRFRAEARIEVRASGSAQGGGAAERVRTVNEELLSDATLRQVVADLGLDAPLEALPEAEREPRRRELVEDLAARTELRVTEPGPGIHLVEIVHLAPTAEEAFAVVGALEACYQDKAFDQPMEQQRRLVEQRAREEQDARAELERAALELERFVEANPELLKDPESQLLAVRRQRREVEQVEVGALETELARIDEMLAGETAYKEERVRVVDEARLKDLGDRIRALEGELAELFEAREPAEDDPEVVSRRRALEAHAKERQELLDAAQWRVDRVPNPMHQSLNEERRKLASQLATARKKLDVLGETERGLLDEVRQAPEVARTHSELKQAEAQARESWSGREEAHAQAREQLDAMLAGRQLVFQTVVPPTPPERPAGPGALLLGLAGLGAGAGAGLALAYVRDGMDHSFRSVDEAALFLGVPALGAIQSIETFPEIRARRARGRRAAFGTTALAAAALVAFAAALLAEAGLLGDLMGQVVGR